MLRIVRLDSDRLHLHSGTVADIESGGDLSFFPGSDIVLRHGGRRATAGGTHGFEMNRGGALVFVLENADRGGRVQCRIELELCFFPDERRLRRGRDPERQDANEENSFAVHDPMKKGNARGVKQMEAKPTGTMRCRLQI